MLSITFEVLMRYVEQVVDTIHPTGSLDLILSEAEFASSELSFYIGFRSAELTHY